MALSTSRIRFGVAALGVVGVVAAVVAIGCLVDDGQEKADELMHSMDVCGMSSEESYGANISGDSCPVHEELSGLDNEELLRAQMALDPGNTTELHLAVLIMEECNQRDDCSEGGNANKNGRHLEEEADEFDLEAIDNDLESDGTDDMPASPRRLFFGRRRRGGFWRRRGTFWVFGSWRRRARRRGPAPSVSKCNLEKSCKPCNYAFFYKGYNCQWCKNVITGSGFCTDGKHSLSVCSAFDGAGGVHIFDPCI